MDMRLLTTIDKINNWKGIDDVILQDGTILLYRIPNVLPISYLHHFYPPLQIEHIDKIETLLKTTLSNQYHEFLQIYNGLNIFNNKLNIFGLRLRKNDGHYNSSFQPKDIIIENLGKLRHDGFTQIASYEEDYDVFIKNDASEKIYLMVKDSAEIVREYASFYDWLEDAVTLLIESNAEIILPKTSLKTSIKTYLVTGLHKLL